MITLLMTGVFYYPLSLAAVFAFADRRDRATMLLVVTVAWAALALLTAWMNSMLPFGVGGDDSSYFAYSQMARSSWRDLFDFSRPSGIFEQPGYPMLLGFISWIARDDLLSFKFSNLLFLIISALAWGRVALLLESAAFARRVTVAVLFTTPLWFYVFFLLKDMTIVMLQSLFMVGVMEAQRRRVTTGWMQSGAATLMLTLFRMHLVVQNAGVAIGSVALANFGRTRSRKSALALIGAAVVFAALLVFISNPTLMASIGLDNPNRVLGTEAMGEQIEKFRSASTMGPLRFPVIYLLTETSGLNPDTYRDLASGGLDMLGTPGLRGMLSVPWILTVAPFFLLGLRNILSVPANVPRPPNIIERIRSSRAVSTPWGAVLLFILSSMAISWTVGDTTRWRVADLPAFVMIAVAGWHYSPRLFRLLILLGWTMLLSVGELVFYLLLR